MDLWVVAAAAGAGYIAKNLQNLSDDKKESPRGSSLKYSYNVQSESRNFLQQLRDKTCPLRRLARKRGQDDNFLDLDQNNSENDRSGSRDRDASVVSVNGDYSEEYNKGWISGLSADVGENRNLSSINEGKMARSRRCRVHSNKQFSSSGSCMDNKEHSSCLHPSMSTVRPVLVTGALWGENSTHSRLGGSPEETRRDATTSSPSLERLESLRQLGRGSSNLQQISRPQGADTVLLFITGMTIGIFTATTSWKNEVDKLSRQLNQMQNLVQDLHEELDMKQMLMVKELDIEGDLSTGEEEGTPLSMVEPVSSPSLVKTGTLSKTAGVKANDKKAENLELLSRIEAELQAELEMLEQNMNESERERISSFVELNPDFEPQIVRGELKPAMVEEASELESSTSGTTTDGSKPANYAVSPWELSLRLHELIESRLETRIKELEIALSHRENGVGDYGRRFSCSETESSSTHHSPTCICDEYDKGEDSPSNDGECGSNVVDQGTRSSSKIQNGDHDFISHHGGEDRSPNEDSMSEDEGSDESEMLLIKQIIERRRSGSSFNFKFD